MRSRVVHNLLNIHKDVPKHDLLGWYMRSLLRPKLDLHTLQRRNDFEKTAKGRLASQLFQEMADYAKNKPQAFTLSPTKVWGVWEAVVSGPVGTPYEGGSFKIELQIPKDYPFKRPAMRFVTRIYHLNVRSIGYISYGILCGCQNLWSPAYTLVKCKALTYNAGLGYVVDMLQFPSTEHCFRDEAPYMAYTSDKRKYDEFAKLYTAKYAMGPV